MSVKDEINDFDDKLLESLGDNAELSDIEFIEQFSKPLYNPSESAPNQLLSLENSISLFEKGNSELTKLRSNLEEKIKKYDSASKHIQYDYQKKSNHLRGKFSQVLDLSRHLNDNVEDMRGGLVDVGKELELAENHRKRILASADLIQYYLEFRSGSSQSLMDLFRTNSHDKMLLCAQRTRQLSSFANEIELPGASETLNRIEKFSEFLETSFLKFFNNEYRKPNWKGMASFGTILQEFNGGASVIREFVNQHEFFIAADKLESRKGLEEDSIWNALQNPFQPVPTSINSLSSLFNELCSVVDRDCAVIKRVFPKPELVLQTLFQRIFGQSIQNRIEEIMEVARSKTNLVYLRSLQTIVSSLRELLVELKKILTHRGFNVSDNSPLFLALNQYLEDLLVPYVEPNEYLNRERQSLTSMFWLNVYKFLAANPFKQRAKPGLLRSLMNPIQPSKISSTESQTRFNTKTEGYLLRIAGVNENLINSGAAVTESTLSIPEDEGHLDSKNIYSFIGWHAEALNRASLLMSQQDLTTILFSLVKLLDELVRNRYINEALSSINNYIQQYDKRSDFNLSFLIDIRECKKIMGFYSAYITSIIIPSIGFTASSRKETINTLSLAITNLEYRVNNLFYASVKVLSAHLDFLISPYKHISYTMSEEQIDTSPKQRQSMTKLVQTYLDQLLLSIQELGPNDPSLFALKKKAAINIAAVLIGYAFRSKVTPTGALILQDDLNFFYSALRSWGIDVVNNKFRTLQQLLSLLMVKTDALPAVMHDKRKAGFSDMNIHEVLRLRCDLPENLRLQTSKEEILISPKST
ncbi:exocyst complex subunit Sec10 [Schizosaccharomyces cryophilus OY26]|uniref:Exocyst complex subunit Sec10 n=1 Tax=Schizosaccharomyces cryophilus (strain OY26 / ATCC MYA-4695 / CBS 11777 / NBRC 106824 / NRRL Y48691) TaxID=653667 RepID=S9X3U2_SCHCR|nr:exocyst complex subunit Sec10 [Schizosaccharomyces cryophilus OY26]EPY51767.1 exocyst complex subunit Sec10 [Schizosaccharomyces cryophilus OY26]